MKKVVCAALIALLAAGPAMAATQNKKAAAQKTTKPAVPAKPSLEMLAAQGDVESQLQWGLALLSGKGAKKDFNAAKEWLTLAAAAGSVEAAGHLAKGWEKGWFGKADAAESASWWYRAGMLGDQDARDRFVQLYLDGKAASIGGPSGIQWLEPLAAAGDLKAIMALGRIHETGESAIVDYVKAQRWYRQAAFAGDAEAQFRLGRMLLTEPGAWRLLYKDIEREKDNTERDRLYSTREAAQQAAGDDRWIDVMRPGMIHGEYWLARAAAQGHAAAARLLGAAYLNGLDLPVDLEQAWRRLSQAAIEGDSEALSILADLSARGIGLFSPDPVRAWVFYDLAAAAGDRRAAAERDALAKSMAAKQISRARQIASDMRSR